MLDRLTKWLGVERVTDALKAEKVRNTSKAMIDNARLHGILLIETENYMIIFFKM